MLSPSVFAQFHEGLRIGIALVSVIGVADTQDENGIGIV